MNREIKFRGLRKDGNGWVYGFYGILGDHTDLEKHVIMVSTLDSNIQIDRFYFTDIEVIPETVGQYTGLNDNNGVEVYEDDNVLFTWFSYGEYELESHYEGSVEFINGSFMFCCQHGNYPFSELEFDSESDLEVIGNIHEKGN